MITSSIDMYVYIIFSMLEQSDTCTAMDSHKQLEEKLVLEALLWTWTLLCFFNKQLDSVLALKLVEDLNYFRPESSLTVS